MCIHLQHLTTSCSISAIYTVVQVLHLTLDMAIGAMSHRSDEGSAGAQAPYHCETCAGLALLCVQQGAQPDAQQLRLLGHVAAGDCREHLQQPNMVSGAPFICISPGSI